MDFVNIILMEKSWTVKTNGKFSLLIIVFLASLLAYAFVILYAIRKDISNEPFVERYTTYFFSLFFFFIIWLIAVFPIILKRKIPIRLKLNEQALILFYSNRKMQVNKGFISINRASLAYSYNDDFFSRFIVYKKMKSHSGRIAYVKVCKIIALPISFSWTNEKIKSMADDFNSLGIEFRTTRKDTLSDFLD